MQLATGVNKTRQKPAGAWRLPDDLGKGGLLKPMRHRFAPPRLAVLILLLALSCGGSLGFGAVEIGLSLFESAGDATSPVVLFVIQPGETTAQVASDLEQQGLIHNATAFRLWARWKGLDPNLEAGAYHLSASMTIPQIIDLLLRATPDAIWVTIPEGYRLYQIAQRFAAQSSLPNFDPDAFLTSAETGNFDGAQNYWFLRHDPQGPSGGKAKAALEGYLFPSTYLIPINADTNEVLQMMLSGFGQQLCPGPPGHPDAYLASEQQCEAHAVIVNQAKHLTVFDLLNSHYSDADGKSMADKLYHALTLASIVERESRTHQDRQGIASVYYKRYLVSKGELTPPEAGLDHLQADPTLQYALGTPKAPWPQLQKSGAQYHLGAYDTYQMPGLPPSPICSPGADALTQAINAAATPYYYFITTRKGTTVYARNYAEQLHNIAKYGTP